MDYKVNPASPPLPHHVQDTPTYRDYRCRTCGHYGYGNGNCPVCEQFDWELRDAPAPASKSRHHPDCFA